MSLGDALRTARGAAGLTQEELAERAGISARTISDVERAIRVRIYKETARRLADTLGLHGAQRERFLTLARGAPPPDGRRLPIPITGLVGRGDELRVVIDAIERQDIRLVTLTGPGGAGKTRLALEAASRARFADAVWFVQLGALSAPGEVLPAIAAALGGAGSEPTVEALATRLDGTRALLVLDTFEHVLDAAAAIAELLSLASGATVLATSREALRIRGEHEVWIGALPLPESRDAATVGSAPSTALFIERARAMRPELPLDDATSGLIAEICERVDALPLAIELAAARTKHFDLAELRERLNARLDVLSEGPRDLPPRHRTMRSTIAWSYDLLTPREQDVFRALGVFSGGWSIEAAEAVCGGDAVQQLHGLLDKSLIVKVRDARDRYAMLDVVGDFARELGVGEGVSRAHTEYVADLAARAEPELGRATQRRWLQILEDEQANIRATLRRCIHEGDSESALRITGAIWRFWLIRGNLSEGRRWIAEALGAGSGADGRVRAKALWGAAWIAYHQGDYDQASIFGGEVARVVTHDPVTRRNALTIAGMVACARGRLDDAADAFERCVELGREAGDPWLLATSLLNLGMVATHRREARASRLLGDAAELYAKLGDEHYGARARLYLAYDAFLRHDLRRAADELRDVLVSFFELDDSAGVADALEAAAAWVAVRGAAVEAATVAGAASALRATIATAPFPTDRAVLEDALGRARAPVGSEVWDARWDTGVRADLGAVVEQAVAALTDGL